MSIIKDLLAASDTTKFYEHYHNFHIYFRYFRPYPKELQDKTFYTKHLITFKDYFPHFPNNIKNINKSLFDEQKDQMDYDIKNPLYRYYDICINQSDMITQHGLNILYYGYDTCCQQNMYLVSIHEKSFGLIFAHNKSLEELNSIEMSIHLPPEPMFYEIEPYCMFLKNYYPIINYINK